MEKKELDLLQKKYFQLKEFFALEKKVIVAFSGGLDSSLLLKVASDELKQNALAVIVKSDFLSEREFNYAINFCKKHSCNYKVIESDCFEIKEFVENKKDRCYFCKKNIFKKIIELADKEGVSCICEGSNLDDLKDYRPGMKALDELNIKSPLKEFDFSKNDIRLLSKELNLENWNKVSFACLASRIPYGESISFEKLKMIEKGEDFLFKEGFTQLRIRLCGKNSVRIEVYIEEFDLILKKRQLIIEKLKELGFVYISLDLEGFRSGSMNEVINK